MGLPSKLSKLVEAVASIKYSIGCSVGSFTRWQCSSFYKVGTSVESLSWQLKCSSGIKHAVPDFPFYLSEVDFVGSTTPFPNVVCSSFVPRRLLTDGILVFVPRKCSIVEILGFSIVSSVGL